MLWYLLKFAAKVLLFFDICKRERDFFKKKLDFKDDMRAAGRVGQPAGVTPLDAESQTIVMARISARISDHPGEDI